MAKQETVQGSLQGHNAMWLLLMLTLGLQQYFSVYIGIIVKLRSQLTRTSQEL